MKIRLFTIPNCITLCNLLCGIGSIVSSLVYNDLQMAFLFVIASAVFDFCDGFAARLLKQYSDVGVELDSLADMVSFGVAPAIAMSVLCGSMPSAFGLGEQWVEVLCYAPLIIAAFSALRLAKFNIDDTQRDEFEGLPTPGAAILCLSLAALCERYSLIVDMEWLILISVMVALLLVSPIKMFSFKFHEWGFGDKTNIVRYLFLIVSCLLITLLKLYAIPLIIVMYIVVSAVRWIFKKR
ncbi:MAG: CDP-diacylglycerol--serine O-phosphatidyltransferase [Alistipes sp.]|nr:CDP-diacylglycerol--serine O-phosphatidyltransferase [Alistipes sp.]